MSRSHFAMQVAKLKLSLEVLFSIGFLFVVLFLPVLSADQDYMDWTGLRNFKPATPELSPKLISQVILHGFLLWAAMGFLTPVGILIMRMSNGRQRKILYYLHLLTQISSAILVTVAAGLSMKNFGNLFNTFHQRTGLALYIVVWMQSIVGFRRPKPGANGRNIWFFVHWAFGIFVSVLGILSIYSGLLAYHKKTFKSVTLWLILFTVEICLVGFLYLLQDKWEYIQKQGVIPLSIPHRHHVNSTCHVSEDNSKRVGLNGGQVKH